MDNLLKDIMLSIAEIQQSRSKFQLEKFVIGQHLTPEMQYYQVCLEIQDMLYKYENAKIETEIAKKKIEKLKASGDEIDSLKAQKRELALKQSQIVLFGAERELSDLIDIWKSFDHKYTRKEIESAQPDYWEARLINNAKAMIMGGSGVNPAHLEAMAQAGVLDKFVLERVEAERELRNLES